MSMHAETTQSLSVDIRDVEQFLYEEAAFLDDWKLTEWLELFEKGASYHVPPAGAGGT